MKQSHTFKDMLVWVHKEMADHRNYFFKQ